MVSSENKSIPTAASEVSTVAEFKSYAKALIKDCQYQKACVDLNTLYELEQF